ncbi:hypothetical protein PALB_11300 [Pseudoalteromonas luteoviolacea B = ATCC 29581]|nr:hypothetical protein PALB_11300 [Pseudoalteromonas luteoviolacea B = ATCC 29581]
MHYSHRLRIGRRSIANHYYAITFVCDCRQKRFTSLPFNKAIIQSLHRAAFECDTLLHTYVLMPDHCHLLVQLGTVTLPDLVRKLKGLAVVTARNNGLTQRLWQRDYYERCIRNEEELLAMARYIIENPLRAQLVSNINNYPYWDSQFL